MDREKIAKVLLQIAKKLMAADTFKCPECGTKVLEQTGYCVKCKKKVKKAEKAEGPYATITFNKKLVKFTYVTSDGKKGSGSEPYKDNLFKAVARVEKLFKMYGIQPKDVEVI